MFLVDGEDYPAQADVLFAGLAPGIAGLYQVNFTVPTDGLQNGDVSIAFDTREALNELSTISLTGFSETAARSGPNRRASRLRGRVGPHAKKGRRALPDRLPR